TACRCGLHKVAAATELVDGAGLVGGRNVVWGP
ncbi:ORFL139C, partial [Human betaherpesvirus 5]